MLILPRSNPLYENIPLQKVNLPDVLKKMGGGGFTGYLGFASSKAEGYCIYIKGALVSVMLLEGAQRKVGFEAISCLFGHATAGEGLINVYRMTADLSACTHALLQGTLAMPPEPVSNIDLKAILARMKTQCLNGTVQFSTIERTGMIFYKAGNPIGFFHDAAREIETVPAEVQRIAALPGAAIEIRSSAPADDLIHHNLLETLNIDKLWQAATSQRAASQSRISPSANPTTVSASPPEAPQLSVPDESKLVEIIDDLQEIAKAYLGRQGSELVTNLIDLVGGSTALLDNQKAIAFLAAIAAQAPDIDPEARVEEMVDLMRSEITGRLAL